ncbi:hypothetical protein SLS61_001860 [Didymella pomorum]
MRALTLLSAAALIATGAAVPNVVPHQLGNKDSCVYWPSWINTRDVDLTGTLMFVVDSAEDESINGLLLNQFDVQFPQKTLPLLGVDLRSSRYFARAPVRCKDGIARLGIEALYQLRICRDRNNGHILINPSANKTTLVPEIYRHAIDRKEQEGVYLGWGNQTTWGFRYQDAVCGANGVSTREFVEVKLLGLPESEDDTAGYESWFKGFVKVVAW